MIPARYASKRFEGKALADIDGKPMVQRVYESCLGAEWLDYIIVVTDDERIFMAVNAFGGHVVMSPSELKTGTDRIAFIANDLHLDDDDIVINVQGDQPMVRSEHIARVAEPLISFPGLEMATLACPIRDTRDLADRNTVKVSVNGDGYAVYFSRAPIPSGAGCYMKHLGIYAYRRWFLRIFAELPQGGLELAESLEQLRAIENGHKIRVEIIDIDSPSVDIPEDIPRLAVCGIETHGGCAG